MSLGGGPAPIYTGLSLGDEPGIFTEPEASFGAS